MDRGDIETLEQFRERNLEWWREQYNHEKASRPEYYAQFLDRWNVGAQDGKTVAEVGPGACGGMLVMCETRLRPARRVFIDYIMSDLVNLHMIGWPMDATYITAPAEAIPLADNEVDLLLSFNCLDHGWDIAAAIRECIRVSKECFVSFDCRGDSDLLRAKFAGDLDHWQKLRGKDAMGMVEQSAADAGKRCHCVYVEANIPCLDFHVWAE